MLDAYGKMHFVVPAHIYQWLKENPEHCKELTGTTIQAQEERNQRDKKRKKSRKART